MLFVVFVWLLMLLDLGFLICLLYVLFSFRCLIGQLCVFVCFVFVSLFAVECVCLFSLHVFCFLLTARARLPSLEDGVTLPSRDAWATAGTLRMLSAPHTADLHGEDAGGTDSSQTGKMDTYRI